jgi:hypothetical protein
MELNFRKAVALAMDIPDRMVSAGLHKIVLAPTGRSFHAPLNWNKATLVGRSYTAQDGAHRL